MGGGVQGVRREVQGRSCSRHTRRTSTRDAPKASSPEGMFRCRCLACSDTIELSPRIAKLDLACSTGGPMRAAPPGLTHRFCFAMRWLSDSNAQAAVPNSISCLVSKGSSPSTRSLNSCVLEMRPVPALGGRKPRSMTLIGIAPPSDSRSARFGDTGLKSFRCWHHARTLCQQIALYFWGIGLAFAVTSTK
jgi:hypothetical protein